MSDRDTTHFVGDACPGGHRGEFYVCERCKGTGRVSAESALRPEWTNQCPACDGRGTDSAPKQPLRDEP